MSLAETITNDMKAAMKAKDSATLSTLRLLFSAMKNKQIELLHELSEEEVVGVIKSQVKQLNDAIETFVQGKREDLAQSARLEVVVLEKYLPAQLSDEEIEKIVKEVIEQTGATSKADMGKVMGASMQVVAGRADGGRVKQVVGTLLGAFLPIILGFGICVSSVHAAIPIAETLGSGTSYAEFLLRFARVLMLWLGIVAITLILNGGFKYMVAGHRDKEHEGAWKLMTTGIFSTIIVAGLFAFCTIILQKIE